MILNQTIQVTPIFRLSLVLDGENTSHLTLTSPRGVFYHYQLRHAGMPVDKLYPTCLYYVDLENDDSVPDEWMEQFEHVTHILEQLLQRQPMGVFLLRWMELLAETQPPSEMENGNNQH